MKILALDLGKFKTRCCFFDTETRKHEFLNAAIDRNYLTTVFQKHKSRRSVPRIHASFEKWQNGATQSHFYTIAFFHSPLAIGVRAVILQLI